MDAFGLVLYSDWGFWVLANRRLQKNLALSGLTWDFFRFGPGSDRYHSLRSYSSFVETKISMRIEWSQFHNTDFFECLLYISFVPFFRVEL